MLVVDASEIDFVHVPGDFENLVEQIIMMKSGIQYYVPISSKKADGMEGSGPWKP
jgi:hypothetical protein